MTWDAIHTTMSFDDLVVAHDILDALEFAEAYARRQREKR